jgi:hypothetical protein
MSEAGILQQISEVDTAVSRRNTPISIALAKPKAARRNHAQIRPFVRSSRKPSLYGTAGSMWMQSRIHMDAVQIQTLAQLIASRISKKNSILLLTILYNRLQ